MALLCPPVRASLCRQASSRPRFCTAVASRASTQGCGVTRPSGGRAGRTPACGVTRRALSRDGRVPLQALPRGQEPGERIWGVLRGAAPAEAPCRLSPPGARGQMATYLGHFRELPGHPASALPKPPSVPCASLDPLRGAGRAGSPTPPRPVDGAAAPRSPGPCVTAVPAPRRAGAGGFHRSGHIGRLCALRTLGSDGFFVCLKTSLF